MVLAALILKEPITGKKVLGIAAGASGALLLILGNGQNGQGTSATTAGGTMIWGDLLVLLAQFCYALYIVLYKDFVNKYSLVTIMKWMFTYSFICILPFSANSLMRTDWSSLHLPELGGLVLYCRGSYLHQLHADCGRTEESPSHRGGHVQLYPTTCCLHCCRLLGYGLFQFHQGHGCYLHFRRCLSGYFEPEQEGTGNPIRQMAARKY